MNTESLKVTEGIETFRDFFIYLKVSVNTGMEESTGYLQKNVFAV